MRADPAVLAVAMLGASASRAELPADGWPQTRRDAALTGRSNEPALPSARLRRLAPIGAEIAGNPAAKDRCFFNT